MQSTHNIIKDPKALQEFIDWLPDLQTSERYFFCLQARKKYMPSLKSSDKTQLKRFVASKEYLYDKIKSLECPVGTYRTKEGEIITDEAMVLYITINPRDMRKATLDSIGALAKMIANHDKQPELDLNPYSEVLSVIHKSKSRSIFVDFEIDRPTGENDDNANKSDLTPKQAYEKVSQIVGPEAVTVIQTRGGSHILVKVDKVLSDHKNWYPQVAKILNCDQSGDLMIPVVGCNQGGFIPSMYKSY